MKFLDTAKISLKICMDRVGQFNNFLILRNKMVELLCN